MVLEALWSGVMHSTVSALQHYLLRKTLAFYNELSHRVCFSQHSQIPKLNHGAFTQTHHKRMAEMNNVFLLSLAQIANHS